MEEARRQEAEQAKVEVPPVEEVRVLDTIAADVCSLQVTHSKAHSTFTRTRSAQLGLADSSGQQDSPLRISLPCRYYLL